jgi:uncharacterized protein with PQ loop repeat
MQLYLLSGYMGVFFFSIMQIPQIIKMIKRKSVCDISVFLFVFILSANICMLYYAIHIKSTPVILNNIVQALGASIVIFLYFLYR